jgi:hypothetical protein
LSVRVLKLMAHITGQARSDRSALDQTLERDVFRWKHIRRLSDSFGTLPVRSDRG